MNAIDFFWLWLSIFLSSTFATHKQENIKTLQNDVMGEYEIKQIIEREFNSYKNSYRNINQHGKDFYARANHR